MDDEPLIQLVVVNVGEALTEMVMDTELETETDLSGERDPEEQADTLIVLDDVEEMLGEAESEVEILLVVVEQGQFVDVLVTRMELVEHGDAEGVMETLEQGEELKDSELVRESTEVSDTVVLELGHMEVVKEEVPETEREADPERVVDSEVV
jgi:hypothetical protein